MPPHEGERNQHSEDEDSRDSDPDEDFEDDFLNRDENETESTAEESLREYDEELGEHEQPADKDRGEDKTYKDEAEDEEEPSTEDKTDKHGEEAEDFSRDDAGEDNRIEQCLDEYDKTLDHSAADSNDIDEEKDANPQGTDTDESEHKTDEDPPTHELDAVAEVKPDAGDDEELVSKEFPEEGRDKDDVGRYIAEYEEALATTTTESSERTETVETEQRLAGSEEREQSNEAEHKAIDHQEQFVSRDESRESLEDKGESSDPSQSSDQQRTNLYPIEQADTLAQENTTEHRPITLEEDPQAFVREDRETLIEQGRLPEKDELHLDDNTTLKFDVNEGLTVIHDEQRYEISTVEHQSIGDLDFYRYKTEQGEEFLHIPEQDKLVPPTETPWYALPPNTEIYLDKSYNADLLREAIDKAGGQKALSEALDERGAHVTENYLFRHLHGNRDGMMAERLIPIMTYSNRDLDETNKHIEAIGHQRTIEKPNLPFNLTENDGARLLAARYGDGTLCAPKGRGPRFDYANKDAEQRNRVTESVEKIFGGANILNREYDNGEVPKVRTSTDIIGYTLQRAGAITGEIIEQNPHVPTFIHQGSPELKREWLIQAYGDEGYAWPQRGKVCIGRATDVSGVLPEDMVNQLRNMEWEERRIFGHYVHRAISCDDLSTEIRRTIENHPPNILVEEASMLEGFGIGTRMYPVEIYKRGEGFGVNWVLQTQTREDARIFFDEIGFPQERKQGVLLSTLRYEE